MAESSSRAKDRARASGGSSGASAPPEARPQQARRSTPAAASSDLEARFWRSEYAEHAIRSVDTYGVSASMLLTILVIFFGLGSPRRELVYDMQAKTVTSLYLPVLIGAPLQLWAALRWPRYLSRRSWFVWPQRLLRVAAALVALDDATFMQSLLRISTTPHPHPWRQVLKLCVPTAWLAFHPTINFPITPFWTGQLPMALLYCSVAILRGVPLINCQLQHPRSVLVEPAQQLCGAVVRPLLWVAAMLFPLDAARQEREVCRPQSSGTSLQLILLLGLGLGLPLHISRWYEQRLKRQFALLSEAGDARQQRRPEPPLANLIEALCWFAILAPGCCLLAGIISATDLMHVRHCSWYGQAA